jgi:hypothetical protein
MPGVWQAKYQEISTQFRRNAEIAHTPISTQPAHSQRLSTDPSVGNRMAVTGGIGNWRPPNSFTLVVRT